jgi:hypothetical protein
MVQTRLKLYSVSGFWTLEDSIRKLIKGQGGVSFIGIMNMYRIPESDTDELKRVIAEYEREYELERRAC